MFLLNGWLRFTAAFRVGVGFLGSVLDDSSLVTSSVSGGAIAATARSLALY